jgi:hypothetical protein
VQIPYQNIARLESVKDEGVRFVGIDLLDANDPDSFNSVSDFEKEKSRQGWHFRIQGGYQEDVSTIHEMLARKAERQR